MALPSPLSIWISTQAKHEKCYYCTEQWYYYDFGKVFDTINHMTITAKLTHFGVRGVALGWFRIYLSKQSSKTIAAGARFSPPNTPYIQSLFWINLRGEAINYRPYASPSFEVVSHVKNCHFSHYYYYYYYYRNKF